MRVLSKLCLTVVATVIVLTGCGGSGSGGSGGGNLSSCLATELVAANGAFVACDPAVLDGGPALSFDFEGRLITYDGNRVIVSAFTMYSETNCAGQVGIYDFQGVGVTNNYGLSVDGDIYLSDGATPIAWTRMSKVLNASGTFVCSNDSLGDTGPYFEAELALDHLVYPTPYSIVSVR
jgi:hypothetical protein